MPYEIVRHYQRDDVENEIIDTVDTLEEAREHCNDPETSSRTATNNAAVALTEKYGDWFDGYREI